MTLNIVGFAVPEIANRAIAAEWAKTEAGQGVKFQTSYGASGDQSRAVVAGLKADYVHFSVSQRRDPPGGRRPRRRDWDDGPNQGIVSSSVVVLGVRKGNPKNIQGWDDLIKPGVEHRHPQPGLVRLGPLERPRRLGSRRRPTAAPRRRPRTS